MWTASGRAPAKNVMRSGFKPRVERVRFVVVGDRVDARTSVARFSRGRIDDHSVQRLDAPARKQRLEAALHAGLEQRHHPAAPLEVALERRDRAGQQRAPRADHEHGGDVGRDLALRGGDEAAQFVAFGGERGREARVAELRIARDVAFALAAQDPDHAVAA